MYLLQGLSGNVLFTQQLNFFSFFFFIGAPVSLDLTNDLLDLICLYGDQDPPREDSPEQRTEDAVRNAPQPARQPHASFYFSFVTNTFNPLTCTFCPLVFNREKSKTTRSGEREDHGEPLSYSRLYGGESVDSKFLFFFFLNICIFFFPPG